MADNWQISVAGRELDPVRGGLLLLAVGVAVVGFGVYEHYQQSEAVANSVEVDATVVEVGVESVTGGRTGGVNYKPTVTFEYSYRGASYTSHRVFPGTVSPNYDTESAAESVLAGYEAGDPVTAYVDPDSPGDAFLRNERSNTPLMAAGIGGLFVLLGLSSLFRAYRGA